MDQVKIQQPDRKQLEENGVFSWPIWEKEISRFDWYYDATETCYLLEGHVVVELENGQSVEFGKGKSERLTQPGKIAIVYSQPEEAQEMRRHLKFIRQEGYLTGDIESLDLDDLPGVHGLRTLRATVNLESEELAYRAQHKLEG